MIIVMKQGATESQINDVVSLVEKLGYTPHLSTGVERTIIGVIGHKDKSPIQSFASLDSVESVIPILKPFKLANKDRTIMLAEAERKAQIMRGEGDAQATRIYGQAFGQDPEFYAFTRSLEAYKTGFGDNSDLVLAPDSEFFKYLMKMEQE